MSAPPFLLTATQMRCLSPHSRARMACRGLPCRGDQLQKKPPRRRAGPPRCGPRRNRWRQRQGRLDPTRLVFIDET
ncbi:MAG: hypothetical protein JWO24_826, partial [Rhodospirillales bacterium]|nr:hypothetical protein [Rhodospirillales bacterium]